MNPDNELMQEKQPLIASAGAKEVHEIWKYAMLRFRETILEIIEKCPSNKLAVDILQDVNNCIGKLEKVIEKELNSTEERNDNE